MTGDLFAPRAPYTVTSETSGQAARSLTVRQLQRYQRIVLEVICNDLGNGCTDEEIVARTGLLANTVRPRRAELVEYEYIKDSDSRRKTRSGRNAVVWCATIKGREALRS